MSCETEISFLLPMFFLTLLLLLPSKASSQSTTNVTLGSFLVAGDGRNLSWVSPAGHFAFGFYPIGPNATNRFLLAIWFNRIPERTLVWSANRDNPVPSGSRVDLTIDGILQLRANGAGEVTWSTNAIGADYGAMLDTGNFVLVQRNSNGKNNSFLWQSFESPTDTILPSQEIYKSQNVNLISALTDSDYSSGRFLLRVADNGNILLWMVNIPSRMDYDFYWESKQRGNNSRMVFDPSGSIYFISDSGTRLPFTNNTSIVTTTDYYHRAILEPDGVIRQYVHPKNISGGGQEQQWSDVASLPDNICISRALSRGSGVCGFNAICQMKSNRPDCSCAIGHSWIDAQNPMAGCKRDLLPSSAEAPYVFVTLNNVDWPNNDYDCVSPTNNPSCMELCRNDTFCEVVIRSNEGCFMKKTQLANGRKDPSLNTTAYIKIWNSTDDSQTVGSDSEYKTWLIATASVLGTSVLLNIFLLLPLFPIVLLICGRRKVLRLVISEKQLSLNLNCFSYNALRQATNGFTEKLGHGSFGVVYKGVIVTGENTELPIAIKRLDTKLQEVAHGEKEFKAELSVIGQTHHKNLVKLIGYCNEGLHRILVYEFMSSGSLATFLFAPTKPIWSTRVEIAISIAKGLTYLHEECNNPIIHCDIKSQNILLDDNLVPKISDFGLSKLLKTDQSRTCTDIRGTRGYVAPEWFRKGAITTMVDVYSFGVMLLEIISCRRCYEPDMDAEGAAILVDWAFDCYREGMFDALVVGDEEAIKDKTKLVSMVRVALWCVQEDPSLRPSMKKVTLMLEDFADVPLPPDLSFNNSFFL